MSPLKVASLIIMLSLVVSFGISVTSASINNDALSAIVSPLERLIQAIQTFLTGESSVAQTAPVVGRSNIPAGHKGYYSRGCGFDMDDDGIIGEPGDDCNVCDGSAGDPNGDANGDPDGDGDIEDQIYVDCNSGNNTTGNGTPSNPYRSIDKALSASDGSDDGKEDIICVRATCASYNESVVGGTLRRFN